MLYPAPIFDSGTSWLGVGTSWPKVRYELTKNGYELTYVRVDLGTSWLRYEFTRNHASDGKKIGRENPLQLQYAIKCC